MPGDKSVAHRALILAGMAGSESSISNLPDGLDVLATRECLEALGVSFEGSARTLRVTPPRDWRPGATLDAGNSGTTARLLAGALAGKRCAATVTGDASLSARPMQRVADPLRRLGAQVDLTDGRLPLRVRASALEAAQWDATVPSAQVKSAYLLAALGASGESWYAEALPTRDHLERLLPLFGVTVATDEGTVRVHGGVRPSGVRLTLPGDPSSAAVLLVAAALLPGSEVTVEGVMLNPLRLGFVDALARMGVTMSVHADILHAGPEPVGSLTVRGAGESGPVTLTASEVPRVIDEIPLLVLAAAFARGESRFEGLSELRLKETDRLAALGDMLAGLGVPHEIEGDTLTLRGEPELAPHVIDSRGDHRLAMLGAVLALRQGREPERDPCVAVSWPQFYDRLAGLRR